MHGEDRRQEDSTSAARSSTVLSCGANKRGLVRYGVVLRRQPSIVSPVGATGVTPPPPLCSRRQKAGRAPWDNHDTCAPLLTLPHPLPQRRPLPPPLPRPPTYPWQPRRGGGAPPRSACGRRTTPGRSWPAPSPSAPGACGPPATAPATARAAWPPCRTPPWPAPAPWPPLRAVRARGRRRGGVGRQQSVKDLGAHAARACRFGKRPRKHGVCR